MHFSFFTFFSDLNIFQVLHCAFLIFNFLKFTCHIPDHTEFVSHFPCFSALLPYSRSYNDYFSYFTFFQCFSSYFESYSVCFTFSMILSFLAIFKVLQCTFFIFHVFQYFSPYSRSNSVFVSFFHVFQGF